MKFIMPNLRRLLKVLLLLFLDSTFLDIQSFPLELQPPPTTFWYSDISLPATRRTEKVSSAKQDSALCLSYMDTDTRISIEADTYGSLLNNSPEIAAGAATDGEWRRSCGCLVGRRLRASVECESAQVLGGWAVSQKRCFPGTFFNFYII